MTALMPTARVPRPPAVRMWARIDRSDSNACWEWPGARHGKGYGLLFDRLTGTHWRTHRLAWTAANGPIPAGLMVLHRCDNPPCVNPAHLWLGTNAENARDMVAKGRHWRSRIHSAGPSDT